MGIDCSYVAPPASLVVSRSVCCSSAPGPRLEWMARRKILDSAAFANVSVLVAPVAVSRLGRSIISREVPSALRSIVTGKRTSAGGLTVSSTYGLAR